MHRNIIKISRPSQDKARPSPTARSDVKNSYIAHTNRLDTPSHQADSKKQKIIKSKHIHVFIVIQFLLLLLLVLYLFLAPPVRSHLADQKSQLLAHQAQILKALSAMPDPEEMQPGIQNSQARYVVNETARQSELITTTSSDFTLDSRTSFYSTMIIDSPLKNARKNFSDVRSIATEVDVKTQTYTQLLQATIQFIEYNPGIDTETYLEDAADTAERMGRLEQGLTNTAQVVDTIALNESVKKDVLTIIKNAETTQKRLLADNNVERFVTDMDSLQLELIYYLSNYLEIWQTQSRSELIRMVRLIQL